MTVARQQADYHTRTPSLGKRSDCQQVGHASWLSVSFGLRALANCMRDREARYQKQWNQ